MTKLNKVSETILMEKFGPTVKKVVDSFIEMMNEGMWQEKLSAQYDIKFKEEMPDVNGLRYAFNITIRGSMSLYTLKEFMERLEQFTGNEDPAIRIEGYDFLLGDGDDWGAVQLENGKFSIWLRGWLPEGRFCAPSLETQQGT